jgi:hypothetical protein
MTFVAQLGGSSFSSFFPERKIQRNLLRFFLIFFFFRAGVNNNLTLKGDSLIYNAFHEHFHINRDAS